MTSGATAQELQPHMMMPINAQTEKPKKGKNNGNPRLLQATESSVHGAQFPFRTAIQLTPLYITMTRRTKRTTNSLDNTPDLAAPPVPEPQFEKERTRLQDEPETNRAMWRVDLELVPAQMLRQLDGARPQIMHGVVSFGRQFCCVCLWGGP